MRLEIVERSVLEDHVVLALSQVALFGVGEQVVDSFSPALHFSLGDVSSRCCLRVRHLLVAGIGDALGKVGAN
ncbi:hypothetical protein D3C72_2396560 [compost metagenome]